MLQTAATGLGCAGWRFSPDQDEWRALEAAGSSGKPVSLGRALRLATLNCLHDHKQDEVLRHEVRYAAICRELEGLDADVIGLNEVTCRLLERLLEQEWVRKDFAVSVVPNDRRCGRVSTVGDDHWGNLLLSRIPPVAVEYIEQPSGSVQSHVMHLCLCDPRGGGSPPIHVAVCATHLTACPWLMEGRRRSQLEHLASTLTTRTEGGAFDACVVMGDFNFHREAENASIPDGWGEFPAVVALGPTWDPEGNAMLPHYLPLWNIYNGLGLGATFGWSGNMRLDRVLIRGDSTHAAALDRATLAATARLFAEQPIHDRARGRPPLPRTGNALREAHRALPWQEYLYPSDHFGILVELPLVEMAHVPSKC